MIEKCQKGRYYVIGPTGKVIKYIPITSKTRAFIPKAEYDNLYYYVSQRGQDRINEGKTTPLKVSSPRRYTTINEVRKAALSKSYSDVRSIKQGAFEFEHPLIYYVYKGMNVIGQVNSLPFAKPPYKGTGVWYTNKRSSGTTFVHGEKYRLNKDGSIEKL